MKRGKSTDLLIAATALESLTTKISCRNALAFFLTAPLPALSVAGRNIGFIPISSPYQHVDKLRAPASSHSLACSWVKRLLSHYSRYYRKPLKTLYADVVGATFCNTNLGVWNTASSVSFFARSNERRFVTGVGSVFLKRTSAAGETKTFS